MRYPPYLLVRGQCRVTATQSMLSWSTNTSENPSSARVRWSRASSWRASTRPGGAEDDSDDQPQLDGEEEEVPGTSAVLEDGQYLICSYITVYTVY